MKYAYVKSIEGYETITIQSQIDFCDDTLNFNDVIIAYRYLYYAKNNTFEIGVNNSLLKNRHLIRTLIIHGATIKLFRATDTIKYKIYHVMLLMYIFYIDKKFAKVEFTPKLFVTTKDGKPFYILDGYIVNNSCWQYGAGGLYGTSDLSKIPFKFEAVSSDLNIEIVESEHLLGANVGTYDYCIFEKQLVEIKFNRSAYIYSCENLSDGIVVSVLMNGYQFPIEPYQIIASEPYEIIENDDWKYYSKKAHYFKENFIKIKFKSKDVSLYFQYNNQVAKMYFTRNIQNEIIFNNLYFVKNGNEIVISSHVDVHKDEFYLNIENEQKLLANEIYLFQDRQDAADDNAEALYRYYMNNTNKEIYFVVAKNTSSWERLAKNGFNLIEFGSEEHKRKYLLASKVISSHAARRIYDPFYPKRNYIDLEKFKFVFLQHGIIMGNHHGFLDKINNKVDMVVASIDEESEIIKSFSGFDNVPVVGLARYDNYHHKVDEINSPQFITYAPSWNVNYKANLRDSDYVKEIEKVLNSKKINDVLKKSNLDLYLIFHPEFIKERIELENRYNYNILECDKFLYSDILSSTVGLITDYSSLFFDILYQDKFVIHHQPYELHHENDELTGYQPAISKSETIDQLEDLLINLGKNNFANSPDQSNAIHQFFKYSDNKQCERTMIEIEKL